MSILDSFRLDGKVALVTGCKRGIGKSMALALAEASADIIGVSSSLEESGSGIERGERNVSLKNINAIAKAFDISLKELFDF
jgi:NAD(P)-dependent dehydrogenase (short-subunit alcohol dehydrogenase family)